MRVVIGGVGARPLHLDTSPRNESHVARIPVIEIGAELAPLSWSTAGLTSAPLDLRIARVDGEPVRVKVHKLSSPKTHLPYDYYSLAFCRPDA